MRNWTKDKEAALEILPSDKQCKPEVLLNVKGFAWSKKRPSIQVMSFLLLCFVFKLLWGASNGSGQVIQLKVTGFVPC